MYVGSSKKAAKVLVLCLGISFCGSQFNSFHKSYTVKETLISVCSIKQKHAVSVTWVLSAVLLAQHVVLGCNSTQTQCGKFPWVEVNRSLRSISLPLNRLIFHRTCLWLLYFFSPLHALGVDERWDLCGLQVVVLGS